ncbi:MAG: GNAT family N-acetyltransferase [Anaerolineales bacterium]|nr:GNAT family N-acetyltransferase [Anaerolineales bacterium]
MMIYGEGIRFRGIEQSDLVSFVTWLNDPEVREGLAMYLPLSMADEQDWFEDLQKRPPEERPYLIEVQQDDNTWVGVGNCGFFNINWRIRSAEVGIFIGEKRFWGRGIGTKVMRLLIQVGFDTLNLNRIRLDVYDTNPRAIRTYEKAGFVYEGRQRQGMYQNGRYVDVLQMSVLRSEWEEGNAGASRS